MKWNGKIKIFSLLNFHLSVLPLAHWSQGCSVFLSAVSYWGHLVVELWQRGIGAQIGGVFLKKLKLFVKPVLIFFTAIPATAHRAVQHLTSLAPPLKNHHLKVEHILVFWQISNSLYFRSLFWMDVPSGGFIGIIQLIVGACSVWMYVFCCFLPLTWGESAAWLWSRVWQRGCWWRW